MRISLPRGAYVLAAKAAGNAINRAAQKTAQTTGQQRPNAGSGAAVQNNTGVNASSANKAQAPATSGGTANAATVSEKLNARMQAAKQGSKTQILKTHKPIEELIKDANIPYNETGLSQAARSWEKHAGRKGGSFPPLMGTIKEKNKTVNDWVMKVLNNPKTRRTDLPRGGVEYKLPNGQSVVFESNGKVNLRDPSWN